MNVRFETRQLEEEQLLTYLQLKFSKVPSEYRSLYSTDAERLCEKVRESHYPVVLELYD